MRSRFRRLRVGVVALAVAVGLGTSGVSPMSPAVAQDGAAWPYTGGTDGSVTLITGDRVSLRSGQPARVEPAAGREKMRFARESYGGDVYVIPADAVALVAAGRLDRRLFNVTKLVAFGYDDRARSDLPLIVEYADRPARSQGEAALAADGARVTRVLPSVGGAAAATPKKTASAFWASLRGTRGLAPSRPSTRFAAGIERVWLDGPVRASLDRSVPQVGAPQAWQAGYTGKGVTVAVLDTGIDVTHPDLTDAVVGAQDFTGEPSGTDDRYGHGTHVASIITGNGAASAGRYVGVAPDVTLLNGKVLGDFGGGLESWVIAGMEWAAAQGADVVNMSLGFTLLTDDQHPTAQALDELTERTGALFVVAAGNTPGEQTIGAPGTADAALTVGAVDKSDQLAAFSSRGPRRGDQAIKPDITAPGVDIVAARSKHTQWGTPGESYVSLSGTSMATPHVAGAAAILVSQHPDWSAERLKSVLMGSAVPNDGLTVYEQGAGRLDLARAVTAQISVSPPSVSFGLAQWPHDDDRPMTSTVTYRNSGATEVALDLAVDVRDEAGRAAPAGMFAVTPSRVTVPAGGTATVTMTADTRVPAPDGRYGGALVARGADGQAAVRTPTGVVREVESYNLTIENADRSGQPTVPFLSLLADIDHFKLYYPYHPSGTVTMRLPKGRYYFHALIYESDYSAETAIVEPTVELTADTHLAADARKGEPVEVRLGNRPEARVGYANFDYVRRAAWGNAGLGTAAFGLDGVYVKPSDTAASGAFTVYIDAKLARPDGAGAFAGSPYYYRVLSVTQDRVTSLRPRFWDRDLVKVTSTHAATGPGQSGEREGMVSFPLPFTLTEYYSPGVLESGIFNVRDGGSGFSYSADRAVKTYEGDKPLAERWNLAVFGPAFPVDVTRPENFAGRAGNTVHVLLPMFTDQARDHAGYAVPDSASLRLYRDGEQTGESDWLIGDFGVPGGAATYRLAAEATRSGAQLSTRVAAVWTFRSDTVTGDRGQPLPLLAVRFAPELDDHNAAPGGRAFTVPVYVQRNGDSSAPQLTELTVQASYDDGATWQPVRISSAGQDWRALLEHPAGARFVSLRATATDTAGNRVEQTIIHAYALR